MRCIYICNGASDVCAQVADFLSAATQAAAKLDANSDLAQKLDSALIYLGKPGVDNGVTVTPTALPQGLLASAGNGGNINIDVKQISGTAAQIYAPANPGMSASALRNAVGAGDLLHEVRHLMDFQRLWGGNKPTDMASEYRTELNAYKTQIGVERGLNMTGWSNPQMTEDQLNAAAALGAQRSVDYWCAAKGNC